MSRLHGKVLAEIDTASLDAALSGVEPEVRNGINVVRTTIWPAFKQCAARVRKINDQQIEVMRTKGHDPIASYTELTDAGYLVSLSAPRGSDLIIVMTTLWRVLSTQPDVARIYDQEAARLEFIHLTDYPEAASNPVELYKAYEAEHVRRGGSFGPATKIFEKQSPNILTAEGTLALIATRDSAQIA